MTSTKVGDGLNQAAQRCHGVPFANLVSGQGGPGDRPQQAGCGAGMARGPLALGLCAQVGSHLLESEVASGTNHSRIWVGSRRWVGAQSSCVWRGWGSRISTQRMRTGGLLRAVPAAVCDVQFHGAMVPSYMLRRWPKPGLVEDRFQQGQPCAWVMGCCPLLTR